MQPNPLVLSLDPPVSVAPLVERPGEIRQTDGAPAGFQVCTSPLSVQWRLPGSGLVTGWKQFPIMFCLLYKILIPNLNRQVKLASFSSKLCTFGSGPHKFPLLH